MSTTVNFDVLSVIVKMEVREEVLKLMSEKDKIENEIKELTQILTQNGVGMSEPLVDADGFPINSIDIYQVRHARHRIICLQNDHKAIMKQIENGLNGYYTATRENPNAVTPIETTQHPALIIHTIPFAVVTVVTPNSPADYAGLLNHDQIIEFGSVNHTNFKNITDIATVVQHSEGNPVYVKVRRSERFVTVQLTPKRWNGKGLLGCSINAL